MNTMFFSNVPSLGKHLFWVCNNSLKLTANYIYIFWFFSFRTKSGEVKLELTMGPGSSSDPKTSLDRLKSAIETGMVGNLTVDRRFFTRWLKSK